MSSLQRMLIRRITAVDQRIQLGLIRSIILCPGKVAAAIVYQHHRRSLVSTGDPNQVQITIAVYVPRDQRASIDTGSGKAEFTNAQIGELDSDRLGKTNRVQVDTVSCVIAVEISEDRQRGEQR